MSNKKNPANTMFEEEIHEEVVEVQTDAESTEVVEEPAKENKAIRFWKKAAPFMLFGGALAAMFALGRRSGSDAACLAMLSDGSDTDEGDEDESDDYEDTDEGEEETEDAQDE